MVKRTLAAAVALFAASPVWAATEVTYMMWDANQKPAYEACAADFQKANPDISIKITQMNWADYWSAITTGLVAGTAPDVFTDHLARYPEFAVNEQITDILPLIKRDKVPTDIYEPGLFDLWGKDGKQFGLPKDWDTISIFYNKDLLKAAGVDPADLAKATWNPKDGGTFEKLIAKLTVDEKGNNATSADFNAKAVKQFGLIIDTGDLTTGQTSWANFAVSNGFKFNDGPWSKKYYYDDPKLAETMDWLAGLGLKKGYTNTLQGSGSGSGAVGQSALFFAGKGAMLFDGSWMIRSYAENSKFPVGAAPLPIGPLGRKTMFNGLADSIWTGSKHQEEAWKWVKFLGSAQCQTTVANHGVVFPALKDSGKIVQDVMAKKGVDTAAFLEMAKPGQTFLFPITDHGSEVRSILRTAIEYTFLGRMGAGEALKNANKEINALFD